MLFNLALISSFLFACSVLADKRVDRRREGRRSRFFDRVEHSADTASDMVEYTRIWAGAVWDEGNGTFTSVTGTFTAPVISGNSGCAVSAWVGIDGHTNTCMGGGLFQAGVDMTDTDDGPTYDAWYEWFPDYSYYFSNLDISVGDVIKVTVTADSPTSGIATIENLSNGQSGSKQLNSTYELCQQNAEWIVEDFQDGDGNVLPLSKFDPVTFTDAVAIGAGNYTPDGATIVSIEQNGQVLTSVTTDGSSVTIQYM